MFASNFYAFCHLDHVRSISHSDGATWAKVAHAARQDLSGDIQRGQVSESTAALLWKRSWAIYDLHLRDPEEDIGGPGFQDRAFRYRKIHGKSRDVIKKQCIYAWLRPRRRYVFFSHVDFITDDLLKLWAMVIPLMEILPWCNSLLKPHSQADHAHEAQKCQQLRDLFAHKNKK